uniref:Uncharacterized protein n=1 Tax=Aegilops tauschii subsp. strangulata TaxID=200361 RepID=A0A453QDZ5_AEGTS
SPSLSPSQEAEAMALDLHAGPPTRAGRPSERRRWTNTPPCPPLLLPSLPSGYISHIPLSLPFKGSGSHGRWTSNWTATPCRPATGAPPSDQRGLPRWTAAWTKLRRGHELPSPNPGLGAYGSAVVDHARPRSAEATGSQAGHRFCRKHKKVGMKAMRRWPIQILTGLEVRSQRIYIAT